MLKWSSLQSLPTVIYPTVGVECSQLHCDWHGINELCPFPLHLSCTECHKLQPWRIHAALILDITARGNVGNPASYPGGQMISPTYPYWPQWLHRNRKRAIAAYYYLYLPPAAQKMNHTCQSLSLVRGGHVCLYWSAAYVAQLLLEEADAGGGLLTLSLGNSTVGRQDAKRRTLD